MGRSSPTALEPSPAVSGPCICSSPIPGVTFVGLGSILELRSIRVMPSSSSAAAGNADLASGKGSRTFPMRRMRLVGTPNMKGVQMHNQCLEQQGGGDGLADFCEALKLHKSGKQAEWCGQSSRSNRHSND